MRRELLYRGPLTIPERDGPVTVEVFVQGTTAVAFQGSEVVGVLQNVSTGMTTDHRLIVDGTGQDGQPSSWEGHGREVIEYRWPSASILWPQVLGGGSWVNATVIQSQYGVRVTVGGQVPRDLPGATTELAQGQRWIVAGELRILADPPKRACGSCGKR